MVVSVHAVGRIVRTGAGISAGKGPEEGTTFSFVAELTDRLQLFLVALTSYSCVCNVTRIVLGHSLMEVTDGDDLMMNRTILCVMRL